MAEYSEEQLNDFRKRWEGKEGLIDDVIKILKGNGEVETEAERRLNEANELLTKNGFSAVVNEANIVSYKIGLIWAPRLDLRGIDLVKKNCEGFFAPGSYLEGANLIWANLKDAQLKESNLKRAELGFAILEGACFFGAILEGSNLTISTLKGINLREANLKRADLNEANLKGANLFEVNLKGANLCEAKLDGADISGAIYNRRTNFEYIDTSKINRSLNPRMIRDMEDYQFLAQFKKKNLFYKFMYYIWLLTCDCGRSLWRWALVSCLIAFLFSLAYMKLPCPFDLLKIDDFFVSIAPDIQVHPDSTYTYLTPFYFSVIIFTTLGLGDVIPLNVAAQWWIIIEVFFGYIMLGGLISILANKLARRA